MDQQPLPVVRMVVSRREADCGICALAMLTGKDYEDVLLAVGKIDPTAGKRGLWSTQIKKAAAILGVKLRSRRTFDLETDTGILNVKFPHDEPEHAIFLKDGMAFDSDGLIWEVSDYLAAKKLTVGHLLVLEQSAT